MTPRWSIRPTHAICIWKDKRKIECYLCITLASQSSFLPLSLSLSLPYPATTDGIDDCFQFDHERGTMPVCTSVKRTRERIKHEEWDNEEDEGEERDREWEEQGRSELTRRGRGMVSIRFRRACPGLMHAGWCDRGRRCPWTAWVW